MKVLLLNGSPHKNGCTYTALSEVAEVLNSENIEAEIFYIGTEPIAPCKDCRACTNDSFIFNIFCSTDSCEFTNILFEI